MLTLVTLIIALCSLLTNATTQMQCDQTVHCFFVRNRIYRSGVSRRFGIEQGHIIKEECERNINARCWDEWNDGGGVFGIACDNKDACEMTKRAYHGAWGECDRSMSYQFWHHASTSRRCGFAETVPGVEPQCPIQ